MLPVNAGAHQGTHKRNLVAADGTLWFSLAFRNRAQLMTQSLLGLIDTIYAAAAGDTHWLGVGEQMCALVGARSASLMVGDYLSGQEEILCLPAIPIEAAIAYRARFRAVDLWTQRATQLAGSEPPRIMLHGEALVPDAEFLRSEFYNDFGCHYGLRWVVGTVLPLGEAGVMPLGLHRPAGAPPFGEAERRLLAQAMPHLIRALQLRHRLALIRTPATGFEALDALPSAVAIVDGHARLLLANAAAERLAAGGGTLRFERLSGIGLGIAAGTIVLARQSADTAALHRMIAATALCGSAGGALRLHDEDGMATLAAMVAPLPRRFGRRLDERSGRVPGQALLLLRPLGGDRALPRVAVLRDLYGLTRAEAEVARALAGGATKARVAAARGLRETTVRTQVRAVLEKTGAANLRDLERLLGDLNGW